MGLAEAKSRRKISNDPNNTKWSRDTKSFGQKILRSQGWEPGQYLGAKDAPHSVHHTAANASFIRVSLKDDMLGLGFKQSKDDEVTGMGFFQDLLGRLNGKSDEALENEKAARTAFKTTLYCETKFGPMRFVKGGLLVGDKVKDANEKQEDGVTEDSEIKAQDTPSQGSSEKAAKKEKKSKKRKAPEELEPTLSGDGGKKEKRSKKRRTGEGSEMDDSAADEKAKRKRRKEERKAAKIQRHGETTPAISELSLESNESESSTTETKRRKAKSTKKRSSRETELDMNEATKDNSKSKKKKSDKPERSIEEEEHRLAKASKKEKKKRRKEKKSDDAEPNSADSSAEQTQGVSSTGQSTPTGTGTSTPVVALRGHHLVRSRWIAQKKMATMDAAALDQIFMIKQQS